MVEFFLGVNSEYPLLLDADAREFSMANAELWRYGNIKEIVSNEEVFRLLCFEGLYANDAHP